MKTYCIPPSTLPPGSTVWAYLRDNGVQSEERSVVQQRMEIDAYCMLHGLNLVKVFVDIAKSGANLSGRSVILEMINLIDDPDQCPNGLLMIDINRLGRSQKDVSLIVSKLRKQRIVIHSLSVPFFGDLFFMITGLMEASDL